MTHGGFRRLIACALVSSCAVERGVCGAQTPAPQPVRATADSRQDQGGALRQVISVRLEHVTLESALTTIAQQGRVRIMYSSAEVPVDKTVSLVVDSITVTDALELLLRGTGVIVRELPGGSLALARVTESSNAEVLGRVVTQPGGGTISGTIIDTVTGATVAGVTLSVDDGALTATATVQGWYAISGVAAGEHRVTARRVGFIPKTKGVTVEEGMTATLNFAINRPPTKLDEVVTTAVGDQRRYTVGNDIGTINVDSLAPIAPVTSVPTYSPLGCPVCRSLRLEG
jgi:Carboxypeptidase regulatory-like domain